SYTTHSWPPRINRRTMLAPIRPRPIIPNCTSLLLYGERCAIFLESLTMVAPAVPTIPALTGLPEWQALQTHFTQIQSSHLRELFQRDADRGERLVTEAAGIYFDFSKHRITDETLRLLLALAEARHLREYIEAMFSGQKINLTEQRAVLHTALRAPRSASVLVDGHDVVPDVHAVLDRMSAFSESVRSGAWRGHTGARIVNVVNIGIGGSDLGPVMAYEALRDYSRRDMTFRFVSNVDGTDFAEATRDLDPAA